jgi:hypothetical protein
MQYPLSSVPVLNLLGFPLLRQDYPKFVYQISVSEVMLILQENCKLSCRRISSCSSFSSDHDTETLVLHFLQQRIYADLYESTAVKLFQEIDRHFNKAVDRIMPGFLSIRSPCKVFKVNPQKKTLKTKQHCNTGALT